MRFGESFPKGADAKNRMDVLKMNKEQEDENLPEYIKFGFEVRNLLKTKIEKEGWPDLPDEQQINNVEDFFEASKNIVNKTWEKSVRTLVENKTEDWKKDLNPDISENKLALNLLSSREEFSKNFSLHQFGVLETFRTVNPNAWRSLIVASSERQLASIAIMEHWLLNCEPEKIKAISDKISLSPEELKLFIDIAAILGKFIDNAYLKQIELADLPGGSEETKLNKEQGAEYLYDIYTSSESNEVNIKTYNQIFPYEWDKIHSRLNRLSIRTKLACEQGTLSKSYEVFSDYLSRVASVYSSKNIKPESLLEEWEKLYEFAGEVSKTDCPINLVPQGCTSVAGEARKVDVEMRLGLRTKESIKQEKGFNNFTLIAQEIVNQNQSCLDKSYKIPAVNLNFQPWAFGPNLYWVTRGESSESQIFSHTNAVSEIAIANEIPLLKKILNYDFDESNYPLAAITETILHETGHNVLDSDDKKISKRVGKSFESAILDELKAESVGGKILNEANKKGNLPDGVTVKEQILAKIGTNLDYLKNKSNKINEAGEPYYLCAIKILGNLLDKGLLQKGKSGFEIKDSEACLKEISNIGDEVLLFYTNLESKPSNVKDYIDKLRYKKLSPLLEELISSI